MKFPYTPRPKPGMNQHTSQEELLAEIRMLVDQSEFLHGSIFDQEERLKALKETKGKVDDELVMYRDALARVRAGGPAFTKEQREVVKTRRRQASQLATDALPVNRGDAMPGTIRLKSRAIKSS